MKFMTRNLLYYILTFIVLTVVVKYSITASLDARLSTLPWIIAGTYGVITIILALFFGKRESRSLPLYDAGFRFNLATFVVFTAVSELWHAMGWMSEYDSFGAYRFVEIIWAVFVVGNFVTYLTARRQTIKGIEKSNLFD